jgi:hypothetical protein
MWWGRHCHCWPRAAGVDLLITPWEAVFVLLWSLGPVMFWGAALGLPYLRLC